MGAVGEFTGGNITAPILRVQAVHFPQKKLFSWEKQRFWDTTWAAYLDLATTSCMKVQVPPFSGSVTSMSHPLRHFPVLFPNAQFACVVYKSEALWGRYFSDCLFVLAQAAAGFSRAQTHNSRTAFFCLKSCVFL